MMLDDDLESNDEVCAKVQDLPIIQIFGFDGRKRKTVILTNKN